MYWQVSSSAHLYAWCSLGSAKLEILLGIVYLVHACVSCTFAIEGFIAALIFDSFLVTIYALYLLIYLLTYAWVIFYTLFYPFPWIHWVLGCVGFFLGVRCLLGCPHNLALS